jgi:7,8-dihydropterin-6-yl-methyl-4-(beta-D-ribofuranosyl)aminobenzene 5'-phosphate synthase
MFDYGVGAAGVLNNMRLLDIDPGAIDAWGLSHGHFDHWGGLTEILKQNRSRIRKDTPLYVGEEAFAHRYTLRPSGELTDIGRLDRAEIEATGTVKIVEIDGPVEMVPGAYLSGPIERVTESTSAFPLPCSLNGMESFSRISSRGSRPLSLS